MSNFYMMVGLPASGKSEYAKNLATGFTRLRSSDELRSELLGSVEDMSKNTVIFDLLHSLIKSDLYDGHDTIYDATNLKGRYRKEFLDKLEILDCRKICIYVKCSSELCEERNSNRDRVVTPSAIVTGKQIGRAHV